MFQLPGFRLQKFLNVLAPHSPLQSSPSELPDKLLPRLKSSASSLNKTSFLTSRFCFFFFPSWQETGVWCSEGDMAVTSPGNRHLLYLWKSLPLFSLFISRHVPTSKDQEEEMNEWINEWMMSHGSWWREHTDTTWAVKTCHRHRLHKGLVASSTHRLRIIAFSPNMERYQALPELPQGAGLRNWCSVPRSGNSRVACYTVIRGHIFCDLTHLVFLHPVYYFF